MLSFRLLGVDHMAIQHLQQSEKMLFRIMVASIQMATAERIPPMLSLQTQHRLQILMVMVGEIIS